MKLSAWVWPIVGLAVAIAALSFAFFKEYQPKMQSARNWVAYGDALQREANKINRAAERRQAAIDEVKRIGNEWQSVVETKTPPGNLNDGGISLAVNRWTLTVHAPIFANRLQSQVNQQVKRGGVTVITGPKIAEPPMDANAILSDYFNYPAIKFPVVIYEMGPVTVRGTMNQIRENIRGWSNMRNYLAMTDGLTISGTSPNLTATYNLVVVGYIRGSEVAPVVPEGNIGVPVQSGAQPVTGAGGPVPGGGAAPAPAGGAAPGGGGAPRQRPGLSSVSG
ncbi:MAG: hypothetical protein ACK4NQ_04845 [Fimbriimonadaceae bacterium]